MPTTLESCETFFGTKDLYEILGIEKKATVAEGKFAILLRASQINLTFNSLVKKAYYKKALLVHPDRVSETEKEEATEKFKILAKINEVLSDDNRRGLYDEQGNEMIKI